MNDPLENVQKRVFGELRDVYSETTVEHILRPRNAGSLQNPDSFANQHSACGESMDMWLRVSENRIEDISFWTDGCAATIACGSMASELAKGKTVQQALAVSARQIADALDNLPEGNFHCAQLAADTLRAAVRDFLMLQREPWKKAYRSR